MNIKLKFKNKENLQTECAFKFNGLDNQFQSMQIFMAVNKKYPNFFENISKEKDPEKMDIGFIEGALYCGELFMKKCDSYEENGEVIKTDIFKTKEGIEEFFKYSLMQYIGMVSQLMGFTSKVMENVGK